MSEDWQDQYRDLEFLTLEEAAIILAGFDPTEPIDSIQLPITERWWRVLRDAVIAQQIRVLDQQNERGEFFAVSHIDLRRWCRAKELPWPLGARESVQTLEQRVAENPSTEPEEHKAVKRKRLDNLGRAIFDAWRKGFPLRSTAAALFDHLANNDDTGFVRNRDGDQLVWENTSGGFSYTSLKALGNRLPSLREEFSKAR